MRYRYYLTQRSIAPECQPCDFMSWEETQGGELTNGKRCYGFVDYSRELSQEEVDDYELTVHTDEIRLREYKTFDGWHKFAERTGKANYHEYAKPGDIVDRETYNYFLEILPPVTMERGYFQVGEPYSTEQAENGIWKETWATFAKDGDKYYYLGHCFAGERKHRG